MVGCVYDFLNEIGLYLVVGLVFTRFSVKLVNFIVIGIFINKNTYIIPTNRSVCVSPYFFY